MHISAYIIYNGIKGGFNMPHGKVLVLNRSYIPIRFASIYSAIGKFYCGNAEAIIVKDGNYVSADFDTWLEMSLKDDWPSNQKFIHSTTQRVAIPKVIRCLNYDKIPKTTLRLTRKAVYARDNYTCYICGKEFGDNSLTLDHVTPKSRGGDNSWTNLVTCCKPCNEKKDDKLLQELHWKPKYLPFKPNISNMARLKASLTDESYCKEWEQFGL
jgi:5-methylcytosine-specific restriction endonuclease McrA